MRLSVFLGVMVGGLYAVMGLLGHGVRLLIPAILVVLVLVGWPLLLLRGATLLDAEGITLRRAPVGPVTVPYARIGVVGTRRGLLLEWPVLCLRDGRLVELGAPMRFWLRADPAFERDMETLRSAVDRPEIAGPYRGWSVPRLVAGPVVLVAACALILLDPPWASDAWPLRAHAHRLPDACRMFDARARQLLNGATVNLALSHSDDSDAHVKRHTCEWNATRTALDGTRVSDVGRLSVVLELDRGIGPVSDAEKAHREFQRQIRLGAGESEKKIPHMGDEAELIIEPPGPGFVWVTVAVRKANVDERIDLVFKGRTREPEAAATAESLARLGLSEIRFQ